MRSIFFELVVIFFFCIIKMIDQSIWSDLSIYPMFNDSAISEYPKKITYKTSSGLHGFREPISYDRVRAKNTSSKSDGLHIFKARSASDEQFLEETGCYSTGDVAISISKLSQQKSNFRPIVKVYLEVDYQAFLDNGSDLNTSLDWILEMFDQTKTIYSIHDIDLVISEIFIWDTPDIYDSNFNPSSLLNRFSLHLQDGFYGDVAQLCSTRALGGGKAFINSICMEHNFQNNFGPYSVITNLSTDQRSIVQYDWSVYSMSHEIGHVLGSPHTHACLWGPTFDEPLDNCFSPEGDCTSASASNFPGGIMSYCYLQERGVSFDVGLDEEPGALVFRNLMSNPCVTKSCMNLPCDDNNDCTVEDRYDFNCNCIGVLIDINANGICDLDEPCDDHLTLSHLSPDTSVYMASQIIILNTSISPEFESITMSAGLEFLFANEISIESGVELTVFTSGCNQN